LSSSTKLILACDNSLSREGISKILDEDESIQVVSETSNLLELLQFCKECVFDIILLDVSLEGLNLPKFLRLLKIDNNKRVILIIEDKYDEDELINAILLGASGYLLEDTNSKQLKKAISAVKEGQLWIERKMMSNALDAFLYSHNYRRETGGNSIYSLAKTELKIVKMAWNGYSNKQIARDIYLSEKTIKAHLYKIFKKLSIKSRSELILYGFRNGLITQ